jgi:AraC-like DNA-binding protein
MYPVLSFIDLLFFTATALSLLIVILLISKINSKNYILIGMLSLYFLLNVLALIAIPVFHVNDLNVYKKYPLLIPLVFGLIFTLNNVFHYFSLQQLISKSSKIKANKLVHFLPTVVMVIVAFFFLKPLYSLNINTYEGLVDTQRINLFNEKNYVFYFFRVAHPFIYLVLGGYLIYNFYKSARYQSTHKSIRLFIFFLYFQKTIVFAGLILSLFKFGQSTYLSVYIPIFGFVLTTLVLSSYIILNPDLFLKMIKPYSDYPKAKTENDELSGLFERLNQVIQHNQLYLNPNYTLANLSDDAEISIITIREILSEYGFKNYAAYINSFRIQHAEQLIKSKYLDSYSIESLCKESGFQSEVTFYRVFKNIHNCTPKEYNFSVNNL